MLHLIKNRNDITRYNSKNNVKQYDILYCIVWSGKKCVQMTAFDLLKAEKALLLKHDWSM